jgi:uncharacterized membrane protein YheB (UPF0754 family)
MTITENEIRKMLQEELTKQEVRSMIDDKLSEYLKDRELKKQIRNIAVDVIDDFFREMWRKNGFWKNPLKNR